MLPLTFMYKILCGHIFSSLLSITSSRSANSWGNSLLDVLRNFQLFKVTVPFYILPLYECFNFSISLPTLVIHFILAILVGVKWYFIVVFMCISGWLAVLSIFYGLVGHLYIFLWDMLDSDPLPIYSNWDVFLLLLSKSSLNTLNSTPHLIL